MKKTSVFALALALGCAGSVYAAPARDEGSSAGSTTAHHRGADIKGAFHKMGAATRHAFHRADAALHRLAHKDSSQS